MCHKLLCNKTKYFRLQLIRLLNHPVNAGHLLVILIFIFLSGSWHFDICVARFSDELLQEHDGLTRVLAVEVPLLIQVTGGLYDDWVYF